MADKDFNLEEIKEKIDNARPLSVEEMAIWSVYGEEEKATAGEEEESNGSDFEELDTDFDTKKIKVSSNVKKAESAKWLGFTGFNALKAKIFKKNQIHFSIKNAKFDGYKGGRLKGSPISIGEGLVLDLTPVTIKGVKDIELGDAGYMATFSREPRLIYFDRVHRQLLDTPIEVTNKADVQFSSEKISGMEANVKDNTKFAVGEVLIVEASAVSINEKGVDFKDPYIAINPNKRNYVEEDAGLRYKLREASITEDGFFIENEKGGYDVGIMDTEKEEDLINSLTRQDRAVEEKEELFVKINMGSESDENAKKAELSKSKEADVEKKTYLGFAKSAIKTINEEYSAGEKELSSQRSENISDYAEKNEQNAEINPEEKGKDDLAKDLEEAIPSINDTRQQFLSRFFLSAITDGEVIAPTEEECRALGLDTKKANDASSYNTETVKIYILFPVLYGFVDLNLKNDLEFNPVMEPDVKVHENLGELTKKVKINEEKSTKTDKKERTKEAVQKALIGVKVDFTAGIALTGKIEGSIALGIAAGAGAVFKAKGDVKAALDLEGRGGKKSNELVSAKAKQTVDLGAFPGFNLDHEKFEANLEGNLALAGKLSSTGVLQSAIFGWEKELWDVVMGQWDLLNLKFDAGISFDPFNPIGSFEMGKMFLSAKALNERILDTRSDYGIDFKTINPEYAYMMNAGEDLDKNFKDLEKEFKNLLKLGEEDGDTENISLDNTALSTLDTAALLKLHDNYVEKYNEFKQLVPISQKVYRRLMQSDEYAQEMADAQKGIEKHQNRIKQLNEFKEGYDVLKALKTEETEKMDERARWDGFNNSLDMAAFSVVSDTDWYKINSGFESKENKAAKKEAKQNVIEQFADKYSLLKYENERIKDKSHKHNERIKVLERWLESRKANKEELNPAFVDYYMRMDIDSKTDMAVLQSKMRSKDSKWDNFKSLFTTEKRLERVIAQYATKDNLLKYELEEQKKAVFGNEDPDKQKEEDENKNQKAPAQTDENSGEKKENNSPEVDLNKKKEEIEKSEKKKNEGNNKKTLEEVAKELNANSLSFNQELYSYYLKNYCGNSFDKFVAQLIREGYLSIANIIEYETEMIKEDKKMQQSYEMGKSITELYNQYLSTEDESQKSLIKFKARELFFGSVVRTKEDKSYHYNLSDIKKKGQVSHKASEILEYEKKRLEEVVNKEIGKSVLEKGENSKEYVQRLIEIVDTKAGALFKQTGNAKKIVTANVSLDTLLTYEINQRDKYQNSGNTKKADKHNRRALWLANEIEIISKMATDAKRDESIEKAKNKYFDGTIDKESDVSYFGSGEDKEKKELKGFLKRITNVWDDDSLEIILNEKNIMDSLKDTVREFAGKKHIERIALLEKMIEAGKSDAEIEKAYRAGFGGHVNIFDRVDKGFDQISRITGELNEMGAGRLLDDELSKIGIEDGLSEVSEKAGKLALTTEKDDDGKSKSKEGEKKTKKGGKGFDKYYMKEKLQNLTEENFSIEEMMHVVHNDLLAKTRNNAFKRFFKDNFTKRAGADKKAKSLLLSGLGSVVGEYVPVVGGIASKELKKEANKKIESKLSSGRQERIEKLNEYKEKLFKDNPSMKDSEVSEKVFRFYIDILGGGSGFNKFIEKNKEDIAVPALLISLDSDRRKRAKEDAEKAAEAKRIKSTTNAKIEFLKKLETDENGRVGNKYHNYLVENGGFMGNLGRYLQGVRAKSIRTMDPKRLLRPADILQYEQDRAKEVVKKHTDRIERLSKDDVTDENAYRIYQEMGGGDGFKKKYKKGLKSDMEISYKDELAKMRAKHYSFENISKYEKQRAESYTNRLNSLKERQVILNKQRTKYEEMAERARKKANIIAKIINQKQAMRA